MLPDVSHEKPEGDQHAREEAIKAIERRRRFWSTAVVSGIGMVILAVIWATTEYSNAGGWPTQGFSQSSGIPNEWNFWIIYPFIAWVLLTAVGAWFTFGRKQISEGDINREIERQSRG
jgi:2TM domain